MSNNRSGVGSAAILDSRYWYIGQRFVLGTREKGIVLEVQEGRSNQKEDLLVLVLVSSTDPECAIGDPLRPPVLSLSQLSSKVITSKVQSVLKKYLK